MPNASPGRLERAGLSTHSEVRRRHPPAYPREGYSVRRLSHTVLRGWPAVGLLVMRVSVAAAIADRRPASDPVELCAALLLLGGAWTTAGAVLIAGLELWRTALQSGGWVSLQLSAMAVALALIGPGVWSIDGWFFGWRRIIPASRRRLDSDRSS
jgi:hypothetical protein